MIDFNSASLTEIKNVVIEDGIIDAAEAAGIRERIYGDGIIDREEADFIFDINDAVSGNDNAPEYEQLFIDSISDHVLKDDSTPGVLDATEWDWLKQRVETDGRIDALETKLLKHIASNANEAPEDFKRYVEAL